MIRLRLRLLVPTIGLGLIAGAAPALAAIDVAPVPASTRSTTRHVTTSRVVERVEIGVLGAARPLVVRTRTRRGARVDLGRTFAVAMRSVSIESHTERCYYARPSWRRYNGYGRLSTKAWYYVEWCGRDGKVTRVLTLFCGGVGAQGFGYDRCSIRRGSTGYSRLNISGTWRFPFRIGPYTLLTRTMTVSARHYSSGRYRGTWWMHQ